MARRRVRCGRWVALLGVAALAGAVVAPAAAAGGGSGDFPAVDQPGVSDSQIKVSGVATVTNDPTGNTLGSAFDGVKAYFDYINTTEDGVYGRELVLDGEHDDQLANNRQEIERTLSDDQPFAVLPIATDLFTGASLLDEAGIPSFGWNINEEWGSENNKPGPANLFGQFGSFHCFTCAAANPISWLPKKLGLKKVGIVAYEVEQSATCAEGAEASFEKFKTGDVVFTDTSLPFGAVDYSGDVARMVEEGVDYVVPCLDGNGAVVLLREMQKQGLDATVLLANAYNQKYAEENAQFLDGNYVFTVFAPFETRPKPEGLKLYQQWMKKSGGDQNENSYVGWMNADLFVEGLKAAGPDFTQQKVVDAINGMTDYTAKGILPGVDWTKAHETDAECYAVMQFQDGKYEPVFGKKGKPFLCWPPDLKTMPKNPQVAP